MFGMSPQQQQDAGGAAAAPLTPEQMQPTPDVVHQFFDAINGDWRLGIVAILFLPFLYFLYNALLEKIPTISFEQPVTTPPADASGVSQETATPATAFTKRKLKTPAQRISIKGQILGFFIFWLSLPIIYGILIYLLGSIAPALFPAFFSSKISFIAILATLTAFPFMNHIYQIIPVIAGFISWKIARAAGEYLDKLSKNNERQK